MGLLVFGLSTSPQLKVIVLPEGRLLSILEVTPEIQSRVKSCKSRLVGITRLPEASR